MAAGVTAGSAAARLVISLVFTLSFALLSASSAPAAPPANDDFADALVAAGDHVEGAGNTFGATKESGEPSHGGDPGGASVWYAWTAPRSQTSILRACTDGWQAVLAIYRGASLESLQAVATAAGSNCAETRFRAISNVTYRIAFDGSTADGSVEVGNFDFTISLLRLELPENDDFANATALPSTPYESIYGSTEGATREVGEPDHGGDIAGASVWYRWTAPNSGAMQVIPCRAGFRPTLAVYTGSTLTTLRAIGAPAAPDRSLAGDCQLGGLGGIRFEALSGATYSIAVDGLEGGWGYFRLRLLPVVSPYVDVHPPNTYIYKLLRLRRRGIAMRFGSGGGPPGDRFLCRLDRRPFWPCRTPRKWYGLSPGRHRVAVVAIDAAGNRDPTPARRTFKMGRKKHRMGRKKHRR